MELDTSARDRLRIAAEILATSEGTDQERLRLTIPTLGPAVSDRHCCLRDELPGYAAFLKKEGGKFADGLSDMDDETASRLKSEILTCYSREYNL